ncbi:MAG: GNAT family N-acetyltransferase [Betaproteobacteria bacterium]
MTVTLLRFSRAELGVLADSGIPERLAGRIADGALPPAFVAQRALKQLEAAKAESWCGTFCIVREDGGAVVGSCGFKDVPSSGQVEIGYGVSPEWRNRGVATGAVRELCRLAFASGEAHAVLARVNPTNLSSSRVVEKLGFERGDTVVDDDGEMVVQWVSRKPPVPALGEPADDGPGPAIRIERQDSEQRS